MWCFRSLKLSLDWLKCVCPTVATVARYVLELQDAKKQNLTTVCNLLTSGGDILHSGTLMLQKAFFLYKIK